MTRTGKGKGKGTKPPGQSGCRRAPKHSRLDSATRLGGVPAISAVAGSAASPVYGRMAGNGMLLSHFTVPSESMSCCQPFGPATVRCCAPKQAHMQGHGLPPSLLTLPRHVRLIWCTLRSGAACVCLCPSHEQRVEDGTPGCRALVDNLGDHAMACPRTGLRARRGFVLERAWIQVVREAIGPEGRVVPQQWLANNRARRRS